MKKKVGIIAPSILRNTGGLEFQVLKITDYIRYFFLAKKQEMPFEFVFYFDETDLLTNKRQKLFESFSVNHETRLYNPLKMENTILNFANSFINNEISLFILFFSWSEASFFLNVFKRLKDIPFIYSERSDPKLVEIRWDKNERYELLKRANRIHVFYDEYVSSEFEIKKKTTVIPNIPFKFLEKGNQLLYVGKINEFPKQTDKLLAIASHYPRLELNLCGRTEDEKLIRSFEIYPNIHFLGQLNKKELADQYKSSDFLVVPSKYEGCPNCVLDANVFNLPVIGYKSCTGVRNAVKYKNYLVLDDDLENAIVRFVDQAVINSFDSFSYQKNLMRWIDMIMLTMKE